jgi:hypothetical protein
MTESKGVEQWFFKERSELLSNTKSSDAKSELLFHQKYISFTTQLCARLSTHPIVTCTSLLLMHRVLLRWHTSYEGFPAVSDLSATMIFIGCKVEESPRHLNQILSQLLALKEQHDKDRNDDSKKGDVGNEDLDEISGMKERIFELERKVLVLLCFDFSVDNPYRHISRFFKSISPQKTNIDDNNATGKKRKDAKDDGTKRWRQAAIERMNESFYSLVHLEYSERHIAASCILNSRTEEDLPLEQNWILPFKLESISVLTRINSSIDKDLGFMINIKE